jgi:hypothetical protein
MSTARDVLEEVASLVEPGMEIADPERAKREVLRVLEFASVRDGYVTGSKLAELLRTSRQNVQQRAARGGLLVRAEGSNVMYPLWQFDADGRVARGLSSAIAAAHLKGWSDEHLIAWLEEDRSRIDALRAGKALDLVEELETRPRPSVRRVRRSGRAPALHDE